MKNEKRPHSEFSAAHVKPKSDTLQLLRMMAGFVIATVIILALYFGQDILIPLALSVLLAFLLEPLVSRLKKWGLPQLPSIALVVLFTLSLLGGAATYLGYQLGSLSQELPQYQDTIKHKLDSVKNLTKGPSVWDGAISTIDTVENSMRDLAPMPAKANVTQVEVVGKSPSATETAKQWGITILSPLVTVGIVFYLWC